MSCWVSAVCEWRRSNAVVFTWLGCQIWVRSRIRKGKGKKNEERFWICCFVAVNTLHIFYEWHFWIFFSILLLIKTSSAQINQGIKKTWKTSLLDYFHIDVKDKVSTNYTSALKMNDEFWPAARLHKAFSFFLSFLFFYYCWRIMRLWLLFKKKKKLGKESMQSESLFKEAEWAEKWAGFIKSLQYLVRILYRFVFFFFF